MQDFRMVVDLDGFTMTISRSDTIDLTLECAWPDPLIFHISADQAEELAAALLSVLENTE